MHAFDGTIVPGKRRKFQSFGDDYDSREAHNLLLERDSILGNQLRALYRLSVDELFCLPPIPTDDELRSALASRSIPKAHIRVLQALRFGELSLGALVKHDLLLANDLSNATVLCLREIAREEGQADKKYYSSTSPSIKLLVARAYFLLGAFRAMSGDWPRYFKYRRVCLTHLSRVASGDDSILLLAAMAYLDSLAYMIYNADEDQLPDIGMSRNAPAPQSLGNTTDRLATIIAANPKNHMWIQGAPTIFLDKKAPKAARSLDAIACVVRTCCNKANGRRMTTPCSQRKSCSKTTTTTTSPEVQHDFCGRNMVLSSFALLHEHEASTGTAERNQGHHMVIAAMDAFVGGGVVQATAYFSETQIESLLAVCHAAIENPLLLYHAGPTYHFVTNSAVMLCHILNGLYNNKDDEGDVFEEVLDTFLSVRKLLNIHRSKLPAKLRCHGIPRPRLERPKDGDPFVDLGDTLMCGCRSCQQFVLSGCSSCVAAARAQEAERRRELEEPVVSEPKIHDLPVTEDVDEDHFDELDLHNDNLLNELSKNFVAV